MIAGIGTDIIEVDRIEQALARNDRFVERVYSEAEREYCLSFSNPSERFAGRFAAKEAVAKSLGASLSWLDVEIISDEKGKPIVSLLNDAAVIADGREVMLSISHCRSHAMAYAVALSNVNMMSDK